MMGPPELNPDLPEGLRLEGLSAAEYQSWLASRHEAILEEERTRIRSEGNRKARRKAAARARKGIVSEPSASDLTDAIRATFAAAEAEVAHNRRIAEHMARTREWQAVQALQGRIIDTATPEERVARDAAADAESDRAEAEYASRRQA